MFSISYPADEHYATPSVAGVPTYENSVKPFTSKRRMVNLYAFNNSNNTVYLGVFDTPDGTQAAATKTVVYPIAAGSFVSVAIHGGDRFEGQCLLEGFTAPTLAVSSGAVLLFKVDFMAYV